MTDTVPAETKPMKPRKSSLSPMQLFYLEQHADKLTVEQIADAVLAPIAVVRAAVKKWRKGQEALAAAAAQEQPKPQERPRAAHFHTRTADGTERPGLVMMTEAQSAADDKAAAFEQNRSAYLERNKSCIHIIDPEKPVY